MKPILEIQHVSKKFRLNREQQSYVSLRDSLSGLFKRKNKSEDFWALRDVTFNIEQGQSVGIIGKNGAGKSTLLKILSKITPPSEGKIISRGRMASLLEVGTGFHPELTGRENIFMNGSILGMTRSDIKKNFEAIVDFSGVEKFLDTPLKHYSSGMQLRLAFAVSAFLQNEILVIDEVLAVGDAEFQKKCIGKMEDVSKNEGRTVLFVSHNMAAVKSLCSSAVVLEKGTVKLVDKTEVAVSYYLKGASDILNKKTFDDDYNKPDFKLLELSLHSKGKPSEEPLIENEEIELETQIEFKNDSYAFYHLTYHLYNELGEAMFSFWHKDVNLRKGSNKIICTFPKSFFNTGSYYLTLFVVKNKTEVMYKETDIISFVVVDGDRPMGTWMGREPGYIKPTFTWRNENI
ncbi:MAG: transporter related [Bacteroidetes bacterium]|nr:transporter related [Bacteroidota bacterium]